MLKLNLLHRISPLLSGVFYFLFELSNYLFDMKYLITESKLKNLLIDKFGIDFTGDIKMITTVKDIPRIFLRVADEREFNKYLNRFGPIYLIERHGVVYLAQARDGHFGKWIVTDDRLHDYNEREFMDKLEIPPIGISLNDIIELFVDGE